MAGQARVGSYIDWDSSAFAGALKRKLHHAKDATKQDLEAVAIDITNRGKQLAPVKTGAMRAAIEWHWIDDHTIEIIVRVPYAWFVEFGTRFMNPQPFLRPAWAEALHFWLRRLARRKLS